jgi:hypothetical protein
MFYFFFFFFFFFAGGDRSKTSSRGETNSELIGTAHHGSLHGGRSY